MRTFRERVKLLRECRPGSAKGSLFLRSKIGNDTINVRSVEATGRTSDGGTWVTYAPHADRPDTVSMCIDAPLDWVVEMLALAGDASRPTHGFKDVKVDDEPGFLSIVGTSGIAWRLRASPIERVRSVDGASVIDYKQKSRGLVLSIKVYAPVEAIEIATACAMRDEDFALWKAQAQAPEEPGKTGALPGMVEFELKGGKQLALLAGEVDKFVSSCDRSFTQIRVKDGCWHVVKGSSDEVKAKVAEARRAAELAKAEAKCVLGNVPFADGTLWKPVETGHIMQDYRARRSSYVWRVMGVMGVKE